MPVFVALPVVWSTNHGMATSAATWVQVDDGGDTFRTRMAPGAAARDHLVQLVAKLAQLLGRELEDPVAHVGGVHPFGGPRVGARDPLHRVVRLCPDDLAAESLLGGDALRGVEELDRRPARTLVGR